MGYQVQFLAEAKDFAKLDATVRERIFRKLRWLSENFDLITPTPLSADLKGFFKLRIGDYRTIYSLNRKSKLILVHMVGHRRDICE